VSLPGFFAAVLAVGALLSNAAAAEAQEGGITGHISAITGEDLNGVQIFIPGTSFGTLTDVAGRYRITGVPAGDYTLRASIIGFQGTEQAVTVTAGEVATVDMVLEVSAVALDEVVATITGERQRRELATDISTIDANNVAENTRTNSFDQVLKGQATGVFVRKSSGTVGTGSLVKVRGTGSISLSNEPLYVIDGAIIAADDDGLDPYFGPNSGGVGGQQTTRLNELNPDEIESIEVIKGPAASALWGARANAGVIVITTKKGAAGETRWNARVDLGQNRENTGAYPVTVFQPSVFGLSSDTIYSVNLAETPPEEGGIPWRDGLYQNYLGNVTGGAGIWSYFGSVAYNNEKGTLPNNGIEKYNFRANFDVSPSDKLDLSFSNGYASSDADLPDNDNNGFGYLGNAILGRPRNLLQTLVDPITGETVESCAVAIEQARDSGTPASNFSCGRALFAYGGSEPDWDPIFERVNSQKLERYTGSGNVTWNPVQRWTNRFTLGYDMFSNRTTFVTPVDPDQPFGTASLGNIGKPNYTSRNLTMQGTTTYLQPITDETSFEFVGGAQWFRQTEEATNVTGQTFPATGPAVNNSVINTGNDAFFETKSLGFFVQGQFDWNRRLFVNGAVRWDNNSAQGANLGIQAYPKFGASFVALEGAGFVNNLRLRGGWGKSGKLPGPNDAKALLATSQVALSGVDQLGVSPLRPGNPELSPETGEEWEAGFDMAMWEDRLGLTFSYYNQKTRNTVVTKPLAPSTGFPNAVFTNIGQIDNKGFEVALDVLAVAAENVTWDFRFLVSHNDNLISELIDPFLVGFVGRQQQGLPFGSYAAESIIIGDDGEPTVLTCDETAGTWGPDDARAGNAGAPEAFCDPLDDHRYMGQPNARYEGSAQTTIGLFKYVQLYALFDFQNGIVQYNNTEDFQVGFAGNSITSTANPITGELSDEAKIKNYATFFSEQPFTYNADWGKLRIVQVRFDLPASWTRALSMKGVSLQLIGENLVTWTSYPGVDPESRWGGQFETFSEDFLTLAPPRRFIGSINIAF
jgi:TonB-linked SusC/RagA family outer membrane protein